MKKLKLELESVAVESFATEPAGRANAFAPTYPPYCNSYYTHCTCTPRADEL
ncbi:MAG: hypothetical protein ACJ8J0_07875 [Longimicrobiaceae bacterium]